jgi:uncharacterized protein
LLGQAQLGEEVASLVFQLPFSPDEFSGSGWGTGTVLSPRPFWLSKKAGFMKSKMLAQGASGRAFVLILDPGEEAFAAITDFAAKEGLSGASLTALGAFAKVTVGWFDVDAKTYRKISVGEQCEVLSAIGDIALGDAGKPSLHLHAVLGLRDGSTRGGHLLDGFVNPTLEVIIEEAPVHLRRKKRPDLGIALIDLAASS